jgi:protocatechuate 3,4-dioxygenase beta subunit
MWQRLIVALAAIATAAANHAAATPAPARQQPSPFAGQTRPNLSGVIIGDVVDAATGRGVDRAIVRLRGAKISQVRVTDSRGRYYFAGLPVGFYQVTASRQGFFDGEYGRLRPGGDGMPVIVNAGEYVADVRIPLWRPAVIHGFVVDEVNEPAIGIRVYAHRRTYVDNRLQLVASGSDLTDDQGAFRLAGLLPGEYFVSIGLTQVSVPLAQYEAVAQTGKASAALVLLTMVGGMTPGQSNQLNVIRNLQVSPDSEHVQLTASSVTPPPPNTGGTYAYPRQYFPGTPNISTALPIALQPGETRGGVSFQLRPVSTRRISGRVVASTGSVANRLLRLLEEDADVGGLGTEVALTITGSDGSFTFVDVPPGRYVIHARDAQYVSMATPPDVRRTLVPPGVAQTEDAVDVAKLDAAWGRADVELTGRDVTGVNIVIHPGIPVMGTLVFDGPGTRPDSLRLAQVAVMLDPISEPSAVVPPARINKAGGFAFAGVMPGRYGVRLGAPLGRWLVRSITANGREVGDAGFTADESTSSVRLQITLSTRGATLTGFVRDANRQNVRTATVIVMSPTSAGSIRTRTARIPAYLPFIIDAVPAGEHYVVAIDERTAEGWQAPDRLRALQAKATRIVVKESEIRLLDLTVR